MIDWRVRAAATSNGVWMTARAEEEPSAARTILAEPALVRPVPFTLPHCPGGTAGRRQAALPFLKSSTTAPSQNGVARHRPATGFLLSGGGSIGSSVQRKNEHFTIPVPPIAGGKHDEIISGGLCGLPNEIAEHVEMIRTADQDETISFPPDVVGGRRAEECVQHPSHLATRSPIIARFKYREHAIRDDAPSIKSPNCDAAKDEPGRLSGLHRPDGGSARVAPAYPLA